MPNDAAEALAAAPFFASASPRGLAELAERTKLASYRQGDTIFSQGDPSRSVFLIQSGVVGISVPGPDGSPVTQATLRAGSLFGELGVLAGRARTAGAGAFEDCSLWEIEGEAFVGLFTSQPAVAVEVVTSLARYVLDSEGVAEDLLFLDLKGRLAKRLLFLAGVNGDNTEGPVADIEIERSELAALAGGTRDAVERILDGFEKEGVIKQGADSSITLLRLNDLAELSR